MRLVVCITVYDGLELLTECVSNYKKFVDDIVICYQTVSNTGRPDGNVYRIVKEQEDCHLITFSPDLDKSIKHNEITKHDYMVDYAKKLGATHFIMSAVDHFYESEAVKTLLPDILRYNTTFTEIHTYYKRPTWQVSPPVPWKMPFICKLREETRIRKVANFPLYVDPACKIHPLGNWKLYPESDIVLHNYSNVRCDFREKLLNADLPKLWSTHKKRKIVDQFERYNPSTNEPILYYNHAKEGVTIKEVPNYFDL